MRRHSWLVAFVTLLLMAAPLTSAVAGVAAACQQEMPQPCCAPRSTCGHCQLDQASIPFQAVTMAHVETAQTGQCMVLGDAFVLSPHLSIQVSARFQQATHAPPSTLDLLSLHRTFRL